MIKLLYEDRDIIVCIKPVGLLSEGEGMPAVLKEQCGAGELYCVHRLDRAVGGLMVYAKTKLAAGRLSAAMSIEAFGKEYLCVVQGCPENEQGIYRDLLFKDAAKNKSYVVKRMRKGVREAELEYSVLKRREDASLVAVKLHTGRSHQIRVQFSSRKMPLLGDVKYGSLHKDCELALWSRCLSFPHPISGKMLRFEAPPPAAKPWNEFEI